MTRGIVFCSILIAAALSGGRPARAGNAAGPPDFTGEWRLDPEHSEMPQGPEGGGSGRGGHMGRGGRGGGRGGWGGGGGGWTGRGGRHGGGGGSGESEPNGGDQAKRPARLPDLMRVTQTAATVSFEDSSGAVIREVAGKWKGDKLVIQRTGPRDSKITETISLQDKGKSLLIDTKFEPSGEMPSREFKRVYSRVT